MEAQIIKILVLSGLAFLVAMAWTPLWTHVLYRFKLGKTIRNSGATPIFSKLHAAKSGTPTMGGVLIWVTTLFFAIAIYYLAKFTGWNVFKELNFLSRSETWLPLGVLAATALVGLFDDWLDVRGKGAKGGGGLSMGRRLLIYTLIAAIGALWFYFKLERETFNIPFFGHFQLGWAYILVFIFVIVATAFSVNQTDGLDGLAGGVLLTSFTAYAVIAFVNGTYNLAALCGIIVGCLLAFLWFNITPARFFMGDTGSMSLGITLGIIGMLTDSALILMIIGSVFVLEAVSTIIQILSKKIRKKKVFLSAPIHHHFEAKGWSEGKIVMRFWVIAWVSSFAGLVIFLLDRLQ
ncbi:MAG TPA: phospho-N-acetylmuramoyl-pentapeptide-transferase [bacterium]|jgi:phospho-N-acetylmuramoyl-pentapeptide-transferase|nr:phospho-N-acetylmuramoyl-pentapeptide-transferase [bacterium]